MATLAFSKSKSFAANPKMRGLKMIFGKLTLNTDYPTGGYTAATLEALAGLAPYLTTIYSIVQVGLGTATAGAVVGWDFDDRTLRVYGTGSAQGVLLEEAASGLDAIDGVIVGVLIYGQ